MTGIPKKKKRPFDGNERRMLTLRAERIAPKYLVSDPDVSPEPTIPPIVEAEHKRTERHLTHEARHYELKVIGHRSEVVGNKTEDRSPMTYDLLPTTFIQLNHGDPVDDEMRLAAIAEDLLSVVENPQSAIRNPQSGGEE